MVTFTQIIFNQLNNANTNQVGRNFRQQLATFDDSDTVNQVQVKPEEQPKTVFTTPMGVCEYNWMPFGLCTAPAIFQRLVQTIYCKALCRSPGVPARHHSVQ